MSARAVSNCASFVVGTLAIAAAASANGGYSPIGPPYPGEATVKDILSHVYNQNFHLVSGTHNYTGSDFTAYRVADYNYPNAATSASEVQPLNMATGVSNSSSSNGTAGAPVTTDLSDPTDMIWSGLGVQATATAKFALFSQNFGVVPGIYGGNYNKVLDVSGSQYNVSGAGDILNPLDFPFRFARGGDNGVFTSSIFDNPGFMDHMVTYQIVDNQVESQRFSTSEYMLFWEDKNSYDTGADYDYNDMAIQVDVFTYGDSGYTYTPEPASLSLLGLGGVAMFRRRNRH